MRRRLITAFGVLVALLAAAQLVRPLTGNPPSDPARSVWSDQRVDPKVSAMLRRACANCHSHETQWPWYAQVSPASWLIAWDVDHARKKMNLSNWQGNSRNAWEEIVDAVEKGDMPPWRYSVMHPEARVTEEEKKLLETWVDARFAAPR